MVTDVLLTMLMATAPGAEIPLFHAVLYGDKVTTAKFSKRLGHAIKHFHFSYLGGGVTNEDGKI